MPEKTLKELSPCENDIFTLADLPTEFYEKETNTCPKRQRVSQSVTGTCFGKPRRISIKEVNL